MSEILFKEEFYKLVGLCMKVHTVLGKGFKEIVYKDANISFEREKPFNIYYNSVLLPHKFYADFFIEDEVLMEFKVTSFIHADAFRPTLNYLKASQEVQLGIIVNFGTDKLEYKKVVLTQHDSRLIRFHSCTISCSKIM